MVNSFLTFENDCYSSHNGIRHSRGTGAYAEVNQGLELAHPDRKSANTALRDRGPSPEDLFGSRKSPDKIWLTVAMGRTSDRRGAHVQG